MFQRSLLKDSDIARLADGVLVVLERVGVLCQNDEILDALANAGATVDRSHQMVRFPPQLVQSSVSAWLAEAQADSRCVPRPEHFAAAALPYLPSVAQFIYDDRTRQRRPGNLADLIRLTKFGDVLHPDAPVGQGLLLHDVPPLLEPLEAALVLAEYARHPAPAFAWNVRQIDYLIEMGEILGIHNWVHWGAICFAHPLRFDREVADRLVRLVHTGKPIGLTSMAVAGATAPVPVAGFVVVSAAEFIATWLAARALNPRVPLGGIMWGGTVDMRTGAVSYCCPDAMLRAFATAEFLRRWCGQPVPVGGGEYCDAREPGLYAAMEKAYKAMTIAAFTGHHPSVGQGMLESGKTFSPAQLLIERDLAEGVNMLGAEIEVTPETMALDAILDVGTGLEKNHLETDHTLHHFRAELWSPKLIDRSGWNGPAADEMLLERACAKVDELVAAYRKPEVDPGKLASMRQVVERARAELLAE